MSYHYYIEKFSDCETYIYFLLSVKQVCWPVLKSNVWKLKMTESADCELVEEMGEYGMEWTLAACTGDVQDYQFMALTTPMTTWGHINGLVRKT